MYIETLLAVKKAIVDKGPIKDGMSRDCQYTWARPDPRVQEPDELRLEQHTHISLELTAITMNPQLSRFPHRIASPLYSNGVRIVRTAWHPEPKLLQIMVHVRSEGRLAEANVLTAGPEIQRRLRHKDHLKVPVDVYRDQREFLIPSLVLVTGETVNRPDGIVRKEFSFDLTYSVETWLLFPDSRRDYKAVEEISQYYGPNVQQILGSATVTV